MTATELLEKVRNGATIFISTYYRTTKIDKKCLDKFERVGARLFWDDGENYRLASGKKSVYVLKDSVTLSR